MAGLRRKRADLFSNPEFTLAAKISGRDFQYLSDTLGLIPRERGTEAFKRTAVIGGLMAAGVPLFTAARLAKFLVTNDFRQTDGEVPSGLVYLARSLSREGIKLLPPPWADPNDFHYHRALFADRTSAYRPGISLESDAIVEIIDRHIIMRPIAQFPAGQISGWIENWEHPADVAIIHVSGKHGKEHSKDASAALQWEAEWSKKNAVAIMTVNLSLAIRNAFDRLAAHRGGPTFIESGIIP